MANQAELSAPKLDYLMQIDGEIEALQSVSETLHLVNIVGGGLVGPEISAKFVPPSGDWISIAADGTLSVDVRLTAQFDDGSYGYISYTGSLPPSPTRDRALAEGIPVSGKDIFFNLCPVIRTKSEKYGWMDTSVFVARNTFFRFATPEQLGRVTYDVYRLGE